MPPRSDVWRQDTPRGAGEPWPHRLGDVSDTYADTVVWTCAETAVRTCAETVALGP